MSKEYIPKDEVERALRKEATHLLRYYKRYMSVSDVVNELIGVVQRFPAAWLTGITSKAGNWLLWGWSYIKEPKVTHWLPLPEPPKEG